MRFGGFPEPFLRANDRFHRRWSHLRLEQLFREDLRDLTRVQDIDQMISLSRLLIGQSDQLANFSTLAKQISVTVDTIRRWLDVLESFYFCYRIRPWFKNVSKSLRKQPKIYPFDRSVIPDPGGRCECFVVGHLLKAVHHWTDCGFEERCRFPGGARWSSGNGWKGVGAMFSSRADLRDYAGFREPRVWSVLST